jgi:hypothetical protein
MQKQPELRNLVLLEVSKRVGVAGATAKIWKSVPKRFSGGQNEYLVPNVVKRVGMAQECSCGGISGRNKAKFMPISATSACFYPKFV